MIKNIGIIGVGAVGSAILTYLYDELAKYNI